MKKLFRKIYNFFFCIKYPFYKSRNVWTDKFLGYGSIWYDDIPDGWRQAFGKELSKELRQALKKDGLLKTFRFHQIKEKWGELCLYNNGTGANSSKVITKYEKLSLCYCINCGKPARFVTLGWISYVCEDCAKNSTNCERLSDKDIPVTHVYNKEGKRLVDYKEEYGIDFEKLWGLNE